MAIDTKNLVEYAIELYRENDGHDLSEEREIKLRTVVNRAYYGAFLTARDHARIVSHSGSVHREVADHYRKIGKTSIGNKLDQLKRFRQKADYEPTSRIDFKFARDSYQRARKILKDIEMS